MCNESKNNFSSGVKGSSGLRTFFWEINSDELWVDVCTIECSWKVNGMGSGSLGKQFSLEILSSSNETSGCSNLIWKGLKVASSFTGFRSSAQFSCGSNFMGLKFSMLQFWRFSKWL